MPILNAFVVSSQLMIGPRTLTIPNMLRELGRRLDAIGGYIDCVNERAELNMPKTQPPFPNRLLRRDEIERQIDQSLFSPKLNDLYRSIPRNYMGPEFIRQLLEAETAEEVRREVEAKRKVLDLDQKEFVRTLVRRKSEKSRRV
jgi:hypothetical protein